MRHVGHLPRTDTKIRSAKFPVLFLASGKGVCICGLVDMKTSCYRKDLKYLIQLYSVHTLECLGTCNYRLT